MENNLSAAKLQQGIDPDLDLFPVSPFLITAHPHLPQGNVLLFLRKLSWAFIKPLIKDQV
jgi:hypothetical protein